MIRLIFEIFGTKQTNDVSLYNSKIDSKELEFLWEFILSLGQIIILGDFNAQHPDWGSFKR